MITRTIGNVDFNRIYLVLPIFIKKLQQWNTDFGKVIFKSLFLVLGLSFYIHIGKEARIAIFEEIPLINLSLCQLAESNRLMTMQNSNGKLTVMGLEGARQSRNCVKLCHRPI